MSEYYQERENKTEMLKFMLQKFHTFWKEGFLQTELLKNIDGFYTIDNNIIRVDTEKIDQVSNFYSEKYLTEKPEKVSWLEYIYIIKLNEYTIDNNIIRVDTEKIDQVSNFYSEKYLTEKPEKVSWLEYIYIIKLNEMLNVKKYELVKVWEEAELEKKLIFDTYEKSFADKHAFGDYNLWMLIKDNFLNDTNGLKIECKITNNEYIDIADKVIREIKNETLFRDSRIRKEILERKTTFNINIACYDNFYIKDAIKKYITLHVMIIFI